MRRASRRLLRSGGARQRAGARAGRAPRRPRCTLSRQRERHQSQGLRRSCVLRRRFSRRARHRVGRAQRSGSRHLPKAGDCRRPRRRRRALRRYGRLVLVSRSHSFRRRDRFRPRGSHFRSSIGQAAWRGRRPRDETAERKWRQVDERREPVMNTLSPHPPTVRTTCPYCGVGCGILAAVDRQGDATISGDPAHPANFGRLCSKGSALGETLSLDQRLLHPVFRQADGSLARTDWDTALAKVANGLRTIVDRDGRNAIAFYLSGQLLTEDYYVANKLMKGFLGSSNVDTNSRLCMASSVAGHRRAFGADVVPGIYRDLDEADLIVLVGSNAAWCHPVLYQRMIAAKNERGTRLVVIDPRRTATADAADMFLPIASGMDAALFCGLLAYLADTRALNDSYIAEYTRGFADALARAREIAGDTAAAARASGLDLGEVARFFELFARTERVVTCYSQGVNQSAQGTDKVNAIINCHLACGRIGRPGMGPFSLTGQPNAMGGREVGGLANQLAAHMGFSAHDVDRVRRFWKAPNVAAREGPKAVQMFEAIARGEIKALWVMATNPAVSLPRADAVRKALKKLELFVISENVASNDTVNAGAHVLLPAQAWGGKSGTAPNSERCISRQRAFLPLPGEARPDWWIVSAVAQRLGFADAFSYRSEADVFREHAALSGFENEGVPHFDLGGLATISDDG